MFAIKACNKGMETIISYSFARIVGLDLVMTVDLQPGISLADRCGGSQLFVFMTLLESLFRSQSDIVGKTPKVRLSLHSSA